MLTCPLVDDLVNAGHLVPWRAPGVVNFVRGFYGTPKVVLALESSWPTRAGEDQAGADARRNDVRRLIATWQRGDSMLAKQIKPMRPPPSCEGVWEFRATDVPPGGRLFGFFPVRNIYIATNVSPRDTLGPRGSQGWNTSIGFARAMGVSWFGSSSVIKWPESKQFRQSDLKVVCDDI